MTTSCLRAARLFMALLCLMCAPAQAQSTGPFGEGWQLDIEASRLAFQSIKKQSKVEQSSFATMSGSIDGDGAAQIKIALESVDTKVDLRNVRMRFLFFESFKFPHAVIKTQLSPDLVEELRTKRRKIMTLPYTLDLHGVIQSSEAKLVVTLLDDTRVSVATFEPISIDLAGFNLLGGLKKLEEAAGVTIVPSSSVNFDFVFNAGTKPPVAPTPLAGVSESVALEQTGDFSKEACVGRFEILSRTGNIYFAPGSARLRDSSIPLLNNVVDIVGRCPELRVQVIGHTDSKGSEHANQGLSERRATSVVNFLTAQGIGSTRITPIGLGEAQPVAPNNTAEGRQKNRRIEFAPLGGG